MKIVQVRRKTQPFDGTFDVLLYVRRRVGDTPIPREDVKTALGSNCWPGSR